MQYVFDPQPVLQDDKILLRPLKTGDEDMLYEAASDPLVWEQHPSKDRYLREVFQEFFEEAMESGGAFAVIDKMSQRIIGTTRFYPVNESDDAIEIGWTFLAREFWGGETNRRMKSLLINYAFRFVHHILFYIGENNFRSQKAVEKLGAVRVTELNGVALEKVNEVPVIYMLAKKKWQDSIKSRYGGVSARVSAITIDQVVVMLLMALAGFIFSYFDETPAMAGMFALVFIFIAYDPLFTSVFGGTIGDMMSGIQVRRKRNESKKINFLAALLHFGIKIGLGFFSLIPVEGNLKRKAIHDMMTGSVVVFSKRLKN
jgi:RimJ/RimL family protein N-acetyltransferase/uncharacterized RDD family membrane protein YckC